MTVSVIFQPVDALCDDDPGRVGNVTDDNISISSCESKTSLKRKVCSNRNNQLLLVKLSMLVIRNLLSLIKAHSAVKPLKRFLEELVRLNIVSH